MKHQTYKDRMHEHEGMMHKKHHSGRSHGMYENEVEKPHEPMQGHMLHGMGCHDFKGEADPIAYGQAAGEGCKTDMRKIEGQMKHYHWD